MADFTTRLIATVQPGKNRNRMRTKERILQVAISEFSEKGLDGARVEQIAKQADINVDADDLSLLRKQGETVYRRTGAGLFHVDRLN